MLKQCARLTFLGLKAKFLSWKTWQKGRWRVMLTFSLFQLPWITSKKYIFRIKTGARHVPTSILFTGLQDSPPRTCFPHWSHWIPSLFGHTVSASFSQSCANVLKCSTFYSMHSSRCVNLLVYTWAHICFSKDVDVSLPCIAVSGAQGSFMIMVLIMQAEVINLYILNRKNKIVLIYG